MFAEYEAVPKGKSIDMLFDYIEKYKEVQGAMLESLVYLSEITRDEKVGAATLLPPCCHLAATLPPPGADTKAQ